MPTAAARVLMPSFDFRVLAKMARKSAHTDDCEKTLFVASVARTDLFECVEWPHHLLLLKS